MRKLQYEEIFATRPSLEELRKQHRLPVSCLVENVRSLYNVGSIFRTSDGVRLQKLYLTGITGYPPRREIDKTALGATESVPWQYFEDPLAAVAEVKKAGQQILALEHTSNSVSLFEFDFSYPCCLLLGNEVSGLSEAVLKEADASIEIPMLGLKQSLNVSVAFGVVIYHILFHFLQKNPQTIPDNEVLVSKMISGKK